MLRNWCVFTSAGNHHKVKMWLGGTERRSWDLVAAFYGDDEQAAAMLEAHAKSVFRCDGSKFQNLKLLYRQNPRIFDGYDFVFVVDDDIRMGPDDLQRMFEIAEAFDFWVCQPAFSPEGRVSHAITQKHMDVKLRFTNFIEVTCPLFRTDKLKQFLDVYDGELIGWGIDWWFCLLLDARRKRRFAVVDEVTVINPHDRHKPLGREIRNLATDEARERQWHETRRQLGLEEYRQKNLAYVRDRSAIGLLTRPLRAALRLVHSV